MLAAAIGVAAVVLVMVIGLVWFDLNKRGKLYHGGKWRLEGHPTAAQAFRKALNGT